MRPPSFRQASDSLVYAKKRGLSPAQVIVFSFLAAIAVGTLLLWLPVSHAPGEDIGFLDALFTATSAVCVTGLIVVDTGTAFSRFGQVVIMLLIQIGGIGIITLGTLFALASGRRVGFKERMQLQTQMNTLQIGGVVRLVRNIVLLVFSVELLGMLVLLIRFAGRYGLQEGLFYALFHSISAFNNAGFSLYADSLERYASDPLISLTIALMFILGGLGFIVIVNMLRHYRAPRLFPFSLHSKIVLFTTVALLVVATPIFIAFEWSNPETLGALTWPGRLLAGFFQAATPRTAGFNTIDTGALTQASALFTILLMFIGASPGSTGGGIKTVTFFVLVGSAWSVSRGRGELALFGRRLAFDIVIRAGVIALMSVLVTGAALTLLTLTEPKQEFLTLAFEAVSAFGTVGLSRGVTPQLSRLGRLIIIALMFLGRVGLLTFAVALVKQPVASNLRYPTENVVVG